MRKAALEAGYTESMAHNATAKIMPGVRKELQDALARRVPLKKLVDRIAEGLDARETKYAQKDGEFTDEIEVVAWEARGRYAELAAKIMGYLVVQVEMGGLGDKPLQVEVGLARDKLIGTLGGDKIVRENPVGENTD